MAQTIYGDVNVTKGLTVGGKVVATPGTASNELGTKGQIDAAQAAASLRVNHTGQQPSSTISDFSTAVDSRIDTKINTLVGGAPGTFDTLKEIADWIATDNTGTAALTTRVGTAETNIAGLESAVTALQTGSGGGVYKSTIGDGASAIFTITHNLNSTDVAVEVFETTGSRQTVFPVITRPSANTVVVNFDGTVVAAGSHRVLIKAY
jgi:hypothetical protein